MKVSIIAWRLFWGGFANQDRITPDTWLERWAFADDGVRVLIRPQPPKEEDSEQPVYHRETDEKNLLLAKVLFKGDIAQLSFSVVPLLLAEEEIPAEARQALLEDRRQDAAAYSCSSMV